MSYQLRLMIGLCLAVILTACIQTLDGPVGPGSSLPDPTTSAAVVPHAVVGHATTISVHIKNASGQTVSSGDEIVSIAVRGANADQDLSVEYHGNGIYGALQQPSQVGEDTVTILLNGEEIKGSPFVRVVAEVNPDEPVYDAGNPDHLLHAYEDWSNHVTIGDLGTALRADGGAPWDDNGIKRYGAVVNEPDPFGSVRYLTSDFTVDPPIPPHGTGAHAAGYHWYGAGTTSDPQGDDNEVGGNKNNRGFSLPSGSYLNKPAKAAVVYEWAVRERGTNWYEGKQVDINASNHNGVGRNLFNTYDAPMGWGSTPATALVERYYTDNGQAPRFPGLPPNWRYVAPNHSQLQSTLDGLIGQPSVRYKQNRNWGTGPGQFSWGAPPSGSMGNAAPNADMQGLGTPMWDAGWLYFKLRLTKQAPGQGYGNGRIEMWIGKTPGALLKVMEYIGDVGAFDEGLVYVDPTGMSDQLVGQIGFYKLLSRRYQGGAIVDFGTVRIWSHSR